MAAKSRRGRALGFAFVELVPAGEVVEVGMHQLFHSMQD